MGGVSGTLLPCHHSCGFSTLQVAPTSSKQHGVNVSVNASATPFQQPSGYGSHGYNTGKLTLTLAVSGFCRVLLNEFQGGRRGA